MNEKDNHLLTVELSEEQNGNKDSQQHHKRRSNQFQYQSHILAPFYLTTYILPCGRRGNNVADG